MSDESEEQQRRRQEALRTLASTSVSARRSTTPTGARGGRWRAIGLAALVVVIVAGGGAYGWARLHSGGGGGSASAKGVNISFPRGELGCAEEAHWSPDGARLAVYGQTACDPNQPDPKDGVLGIFDGATGKARATIQLDPLTIAKVVPQTLDPAALQADATLPSQIPFVYYGTVGWSPDGQRFAIRVGVDTGTYRQTAGHHRVSAADYWFAMLVINVASQDAEATVTPASTGAVYSPTTSFQPLEYTRWDLSAHTATALRMPQALGYAWTGSGTLQPTVALPSSPTAAPPPAPSGPVGQPIGGQSFSMWQMAQPRYDNTSCGHGTFPIGLTATAWSPDGRYIADNVRVFGRVDSADVGATQPSINCSYDEQNAKTHARMPVRDTALKAVLLAEAHAADGNLTQRTLYWDPTGAYLAVLASSQYIAPSISIYSTASGSLLKRLDGKAIDPRYNPHAPAPLGLAWSPDGQRLAVYDANHLTVLAGQALGK